MATPPSFPTLAGLGWSVHKKPVFSTLVASHVSGREVREALYQNPIWSFELTYDGLSSSPTAYPGLGVKFAANAVGIFLTASRAIRDLPFRRSDRQRRDGRDLRHRRWNHADFHLLPLHGRFPRAGRLGSGGFVNVNSVDGVSHPTRSLGSVCIRSQNSSVSVSRITSTRAAHVQILDRRQLSRLRRCHVEPLRLDSQRSEATWMPSRPKLQCSNCTREKVAQSQSNLPMRFSMSPRIVRVMKATLASCHQPHQRRPRCARRANCLCRVLHLHHDDGDAIHMDERRL